MSVGAVECLQESSKLPIIYSAVLVRVQLGKELFNLLHTHTHTHSPKAMRVRVLKGRQKTDM